MASLSWNASEAANFYIVTAQTNSGHKVQLSTNDTWTYISEFQCGQEYFLSVQAVDSVCTSQPSQASSLLSGIFQKHTHKYFFSRVHCSKFLFIYLQFE